MDTPTRPSARELPSVRDLIAELAATEDVLREHRRAAGSASGSTDLAVLHHRQREIVGELRRRRSRPR